jgi:hypothetical protein
MRKASEKLKYVVNSALEKTACIFSTGDYEIDEC